MQVVTQIGTTRDFQLKQALLIYEDQVSQRVSNCAQGTVPEQVATAEVHLILPTKSALVVKKISLQFSCKIVNATKQWSRTSLRDAVVVLTVRSHETTSTSVLISLRLYSLDGSANEQQEYWAPLSLSGGTPPRHWEKLDHSSDAFTITVHPGDLLWGRAISSVWPSHELNEVIPPGKYRLHREVSLENRDKITSNDVVVSIGK
jgi:hypothetical protein